VFFRDNRLQYTVRCEKPNPVFAKMLQQAIGGVEGEIRVCLQYLFQGWGYRGPTKYKDMLLNTATEEIGHIEMLAYAVALNLENAPASMQEEAAGASSVVETVLGGGNAKMSIETILAGMAPRHLLSTGLAASPEDANGNPFDASHVYASGNAAGDMYSNIAAEATGRVLACRLYHLTDDPGMKDFLSFLIARDTMHQQQWLAVIEEMGGPASLPIPNSFNQANEATDFSYVFIGTNHDGSPPPAGRWTQGPTLDGKGTFSAAVGVPHGQEPILGPARPDSAAQVEQMSATPPA
jgi:Mn-containing catalase